MSQVKGTKDERFMMKLYEMGQSQGDVFIEQDGVMIAQSIGISEKAAHTIINTLAGTNFIKKMPEGKVCLTPHGEKLCKSFS